MNYRKATFKDINSIASLVTNLLGTCNLESNSDYTMNVFILNFNYDKILFFNTLAGLPPTIA